MRLLKKIGLSMIILAVAVAAFGLWLKEYNDRLTELQLRETGSCYLDDGTCLHSVSDKIFLLTSGISIVLVVLGLYMFFIRSPNAIQLKTQKINDIEIQKNKVEAPATLTNEYKKIFDLVAESDGAILQGELVTKSGLDKVKVSRILDKLEIQGLIERRRHGMSNLVLLKKKWEFYS